jgi:signal transduction histidine kinase
MNVLNALTLSLFGVAAILASAAAVAWRSRSAPGARSFAAFLAGLFVWTLAVALEAAAGAGGSESAVLFFASLEYLGIGIAPVAWLVFALEYTGREEWVSWPVVGTLSVVPLVTLALAFSYHPLFRSVLEPAATGQHALFGVTFLEVQLSFGPWFWLFVGYGYFLMLCGSALLIRVVVTAPWLYRTRLLPIILGLTFPLALNVLFLVESPPVPVNPTPYAFALTAVPVSWALLDGELFEHVPVPPGIANQFIVQELDAAVFVVDSGHRVVECNPAAQSMSALADPYGRSLSAVLPTLVTDAGTVACGTTAITIDSEQRYVDVSTTDLDIAEAHTVGMLVTLRDVTGRQLREQRLDVLHRILRHNVRQTSNVILGHGSALESELERAELADRAETITKAADRLADWSERAGSLDHALPPLNDNRTDLDLVAAVEAAIDNVVDPEADVAIDLDCPDRQPVTAHPSMQEAIEELLENGIRHNDSEHPIVDVELDTDEDTVTLQITDNGPGIPEAERAVIERGRETPLEHGSGLGLWLASWSVRASGGEFSLRTDSSGTTVIITLGAAQSPESSVDTERGRRDVSTVDPTGRPTRPSTPRSPFGTPRSEDG